MMVVGKDELLKLKEIVWTYINTFGTKYKNNYYCDIQKRNNTTFDLDKLINTVNCIIYRETLDQPFNQIETANWTCFEMRAKEKLKPDRKDILLSGSGRTMMIHLLLLENINNYKKEYQT